MRNPKNDGINTQDVLAMRGDGYYSQRTAGAKNVINDASAMVFDALRDLPPLHADLTPVFMLRVYSAPAHRTHNLQESQNLVLPNAPSFPPAACCRR